MKKLLSVMQTLAKKRITIASAESCSGGYLSYLLTKIPGSSKVFKGGIVAYSLQAKNRFFKIPYPLLKRTQGVSAPVARDLAKKVRILFGTDMGVSLVGFAGPRAKKGVTTGTVFMGLSCKNETYVTKFIIKGNRDTVRRKSSEILIGLIYKKMK